MKPELNPLECMTTLKFLRPQQNEQALTQYIQENSRVSSFAHQLLLNKPIIKFTVDSTPVRVFKKGVEVIDYTGLRGSDFGDDFYYIGRYVEINRLQYASIYLDQQASPIALKAQGKTFVKRPWSLSWEEIPSYIKDHIFNHRLLVEENHSSISEYPLSSFRTSHQYKQTILQNVGKWYDDLKVIGKKAFMRAIAMAGTSYTTRHYSRRPFIQGYLTNALQLASSDAEVHQYYQRALTHKMGLLSGPSEVAHGVVNLVREIYTDDFVIEEYFRYMTVALCLGALGYPYNHHSFYEIVTVVFPDYPELHILDNFQRKLFRIINH